MLKLPKFLANGPTSRIQEAFQEQEAVRALQKAVR